MTRLAIVIALMTLGACFQSHPQGQQELSGQDCYTCHTSNYEATAAPVHRDAPATYSTSCANCHSMTGWQPALEGLHNEMFVITQGAHANIACQGCHDLSTGLPSKLGANTNCIQCHPDNMPLTTQHVGVTLFVNQPYVYQPTVPNFCVQCHPTGLGEQHPEPAFARTGNHAVVCGDCHDRTRGPDTKGKNVTCIESRCHHTVRATDGTNGHEGGDYDKIRGSGTDPTFCHKCH